MDGGDEANRAEFTALLEHLTGPSRGVITWLTAPSFVLSLGADRKVVIAEDQDPDDHNALALFTTEHGVHGVEALHGHRIWINKRLVGAGQLRDGDVIEFDEIGPISRYRRFDGRHPLRWTVNEMAADSLAYLRASRRPLGGRLRRAAGEFARRLIWQTTLIFRLTVLVAIAGLGLLVYNLYQTNQQLAAIVAQDSDRIDDVADTLVRTRDEALKPGDLAELRAEMGEQLTTSFDRLSALERQTGATARVIADAIEAVAFLQGAYGLRDEETGRMLRHVTAPGGVPMITPQGKPFLSLEGDGPVAEVQFTGTGFLLGDSGLVVTNRHVALPWEKSGAQGPAGTGLKPTMIRFIGYFPGAATPFSAEVTFASDTADLAVLRLKNAPDGMTGLSLAEAAPAAGDAVVVMGYPTGLRALLAQAGSAFVKTLQDAKDTGFWSVAERLAKAKKIRPLATRGIVGQVASDALVYDAETTHGGSGGPVLNADGAVVAINAAILPEFGGSNIGVPTAKLKALLAANDSGG